MAVKSRDNRGPGRYNNGKPAKSGPPTYSQTRRTRTSLVRIAGTETVLMTPAEHEDAIEALAVLIGRYLTRDHSPPSGRPDT